MSEPETFRREAFTELMEGVQAMKAHREGTLELRRTKLPPSTAQLAQGSKPGPKQSAK